jgi:hypothetical protein
LFSLTDLCEFCENETYLKTKIASILKEINHPVADSFDFEDLEKQSDLNNITEENKKLEIKKVILLLQDKKSLFF